MAAGRMVIAGWMPALDANGLPIPNAQMYFYENNTTTLATVYANSSLTTPLANPVLANSSGQFPEIWADDANTFSVTIAAPYGPPGQPFSFNDVGPATSANSPGTYQGGWNAETNTPEIVSGEGNNGDYYYVTVAGDTVIDGYPSDPMTEAWEVGDQIRFSTETGTWQRFAAAKLGRNLGGWDAVANVPEIQAGIGVEGDFYTVIVEGARDIEPPEMGADPINWLYGDQVRFVAGGWIKTNTSATARNIAYAVAGVPVTEEISVLDYLRSTANPTLELLAAEAYSTVSPQDMGPELQELLDAAREIKLPEVKLVKNYYLTTLVTIPEDVKIIGVTGGGEEVNKLANASATRMSLIVCSGAGGLALSARSGLERIALMKEDELVPPTTLAEALAVQAARSGTAITVHHAPDATIRDCYIVGFDLAISCSESERWTIENNKIDCTNGIYTTLTFDVGRCHNNHIWPFWPTHIVFGDGDYNDAYIRDGYAICSDGPNDGCLYTNNLTFGYRYGGWVRVNPDGPLPNGSNYANKWRGNWIDNRIEPWGEEVTYGIRLEGDVRLCTIEDNHFDQVTVGLDMVSTPNLNGRTPNIATGNTFGLCSYRWIRCGVGHGIINGVAAGGGSGDYGIEFLPGCGYWVVDNVMASDATNQESGGPNINLFGYQGADLPKITIGNVSVFGGVSHDYRAFGTSCRVNRNGIDYSYTSPNVEIVVQFTSKPQDSLGEFNTGTGEFTAAITGAYTIDGCIGFTTAETGPTAWGVYLYSKQPAGSWTKVKMLAQGVTTTPGLYGNTWACVVNANAGTQYRVQFVNGANCTVEGDTNITNLYFYRLPIAR